MFSEPLKQLDGEMMNGWIVTWDGTGSVDRGKIVAAFNEHYEKAAVAKFMEQLYISLQSADADKIRYAKSSATSPYPANVRCEDTRITCGNNPWLKGRFVHNIRETASGFTWDEPHSGAAKDVS